MKELKYNEHIIIFDADLYDEISAKYGFYVAVNQTGYKRVACAKGMYKGKTLARYLMDCPKHLQVDHINGNSLDNRLANLRLVLPRQNSANTCIPKNKTNSLPKGVTLRKNGLGIRYIAQIVVNRTVYCLGTFDTVEEAEARYKKEADKSFGVYASHNSRL
jgi:hypothetical protein